MKTYRVTSRITQERHIVEAPSAQEARAALGWMIGDCHVQQLKTPPVTACQHLHTRHGQCQSCGETVR